MASHPNPGSLTQLAGEGLGVAAVAEVWVRWATTNAPPAMEAWLHPDERARLHALREEADRARFSAAHVLVRQVVGERCGVPGQAVQVVQRCRRCGGPHGEPTVTLPHDAGRPPRVSLSHAGGLVVVAVSQDRVGVDVEPLAPARPELEGVLLSSREQHALAGLPPDERPLALTRWWVRKEAILKATGHGFDLDPRAVEVTAPPRPPAVVATSVDLGGPLHLYEDRLDVDGAYVVAIAAGGTHRPRITRAPHAAW